MYFLYSTILRKVALLATGCIAHPGWKGSLDSLRSFKSLKIRGSQALRILRWRTQVPKIRFNGRNLVYLGSVGASKCQLNLQPRRCGWVGDGYVPAGSARLRHISHPRCYDRATNERVGDCSVVFGLSHRRREKGRRENGPVHRSRAALRPHKSVGRVLGLSAWLRISGSAFVQPELDENHDGRGLSTRREGERGSGLLAQRSVGVVLL